MEGRGKMKVSQVLSRVESRFFGALSQLDEFSLNPQVRVLFRSIPETSRNSNGESQETKEARSLNYPHPEVGVYISQAPQTNDPE